MECPHLRKTAWGTCICVKLGKMPKLGEAIVPDDCPFIVEQTIDASETYYCRGGSCKGERI